MKAARNITISVLAFASMAYVGYSYYFNPPDPCEKPLKYSIGRFDSQFGISQEDLRAYTAEAASIWQKAIGREMFVYDADAGFKINLIYDERQIATVQKQRTESGLSLVEAAFKVSDAQFKTFKTRYDEKLAAYEQAFAAYEERKSAYDEAVSEWNARGGAPKDEYEALELERRYLNEEARRLNKEVSAIKNMAAELGAILTERNTKASEYNKAAQAYNAKYNQNLEFNQAEYNGKEINIYQFGNKNDLVLALAHEFGHTLGMGHTDNPDSVMYYLTTMNAETTPVLTAEDLAELQRVCR